MTSGFHVTSKLQSLYYTDMKESMTYEQELNFIKVQVIFVFTFIHTGTILIAIIQQNFVNSYII